MESTSLISTILNIIPDNPINSLASGNMLQIIVFALIVGLILAKIGRPCGNRCQFYQPVQRYYDGNDHDGHGDCTGRSLLSGGKNFCKYRIFCVGTAGKIYDCSVACTGIAVPGCLPDPVKDLYRTESDSVPEEIFPGYGICIFHSHFQCDHSAVHRYTG